jgi:chaperonin cofactor prefoldin
MQDYLVDQLRRRVDDLEREVADLQRQNEQLRESVKALLAPARPPVPQTGLW